MGFLPRQLNIEPDISNNRHAHKPEDEERDFQMSDFYIQKLDYAKTIDDITEIHDHMVLDLHHRLTACPSY